ncbi:hypothetical protein [Maridesulfovibrio sp.]|uniref:hypothetical protein n=1 Tax=Maridesulfovibrio sp. TaxID=2795000 RepID=UPI0029C9D05D|nr:hypothetical protein [Maridesulfovibrio sp.]
MGSVATWPKGPTYWTENGIPHVSIPFTWNLPEVREWLTGNLFHEVRVGGPAAYLKPEFFADMPNVTIEYSHPGVLQLVNPMATRTTTGCVNKCKFCAIGEGLVEPGGLVELDDWPDLPVLCDNNILAASPEHFDRVMERLERWDKRKIQTDFNQGVDARILNDHHAERIGRLKRMMVRLAFDHFGMADKWERAFKLLVANATPKSRIRSYCLIGFNSGPRECWERCLWVESHGVKALPMWFHPLGAIVKNAVTQEQTRLGWNDIRRRHIMGYFYKHRGEIPAYVRAAA